MSTINTVIRMWGLNPVVTEVRPATPAVGARGGDLPTQTLPYANAHRAESRKILLGILATDSWYFSSAFRRKTASEARIEADYYTQTVEIVSDNGRVLFTATPPYASLR